MTTTHELTADQLQRIRAAAVVLLPGSATSPPVDALPEFDGLVSLAAKALGSNARELDEAVGAIPITPSWESMADFAVGNTEAFDLVSLIAAGAYFMSPSVLASLGVPAGERRAADAEQVVDELDSGILDAVFDRGCPVRTLDEVNERSAS